MNKKGFTLIEVIVSVVLVSIIMVSLTATIVELRNTYDKVKENSDVLVYSSVTSRVINNDISSNEGIRYIECNTSGTECGMVLGNNNKRLLKIYDSTDLNSGKLYYNSENDNYILKVGTNPVRAIDIVKDSGVTKANIESCHLTSNCQRVHVGKDGCECIKETHETTLLYEDITNNTSSSLLGATNPIKTLYIRTLSLDRIIDYKTKRISTEGYNYLNFDVSQYSYINKHANKDLSDPSVFNVLSKLTISIYNGLDTENDTYDIVLYSSSRTDQAKARVGDKFTISLNSRNGLTGSEINDLVEPYIEVGGVKHNVSTIVEKYNNGFEFTDKDHNVMSINAISPPVPKNTSKTFLGYFTGNCGGTKVIDEFGNIIVPTNFFDSDTTIKSCWGQMTNMVTFDPEGVNITCPSDYSNESGKCTKLVTYGNTYGGIPNAPSKEGYTFLYWVVKNEGEYGEQIFDNSIVNYLIKHTVVPMWQANSLHLTYNVNGGTCSNCAGKTVTYGSPYGVLPTNSVMSRTDYSFSGWYTASEGGEEITSDSIVNYSKGDTITLYAHWIPTKIKVTLDPNKGSVSTNEVTVLYGQPYGVLPEATMPGRTFAGWWTQLNGGELINSESLVVATSNQTLYAHWLSDTYMVTLDPKGGSISETEIKVSYGENYGTLPKPSKGLITFTNWNTKEDCTGSIVNAKTKVTQTSDHTLYACYSNTYTEYELLANTKAFIINCAESISSLNNECYDETTCDSTSYCSSGTVKAGAKLFVDYRSHKEPDTMLNAYVHKNDINSSSGGFNCISSGNANNSECNYSKLYKTNHATYFLHSDYVKVRLNYVSGGASLMKNTTLSDIRNIPVSTNE